MNEMKIAQALESYLVASNVREPSTKERKFYLSDMGKCMRVRWLKRKGVETELEPYVNWIFKMGDLVHSFGYKALESQGLLLEAEDYVSTEHFIGRYDGIIKNLEDKKKSVFDFKSVNPYKMKKYIAGEDDEENIEQVLSYTMLLKEKRKDISETAYMLYINKEPSDAVTPVVFFQKEYHLTTWRIKQLKEEMDTLINLWDKDKIPPCSCPGWMKNYNSFQPLCQATEADIKKVLNVLDKGKKIVSTKKAVYLINNDIKKEVLKI
jgi:hypothetical protein